VNAAAAPQTMTVQADAPFRLRLPVRAGAEPRRFSLEIRRNDGPWTPVEAHGFPLPKRELAVDFAAPEAAGLPMQAIGAVTLDRSAAALRLEAGADGGYALVDSPWPLDAFSFAAEITLPQSGVAALVFGFQGAHDHARLVLDAGAGEARLERILTGEVRTLARAPAALARGDRLQVEVQGEDGLLEAEVGDVALSASRPADLPVEALGFHLAGGVMQVHALELAGEASSPPVSLVESPFFDHGADTAPGVGGGAPGLAAPLQDVTPLWSAAPGTAGEVVWPLVIRRFADGAALSEDGDRFAFRVVDAAGRPANPGSDALVTLQVSPGHLGGTFVETPGRIGPFRSASGALYFIMEPAETDNLFMMVKSEDGGRTWREVDAAGRPATGDLEAVDARQAGGSIVVLHQITEGVVLHTFNTNDDPARPDQWIEIDAPVAAVEAVSQMATLAVRPDGGLAAVFLGDQLYYALRAPDGAWSDIAVLDPDADSLTVGPQAAAGADGVVHIAYADAAGRIWLRTLGADDALGARRLIAQGAVTGEDDYGAVLPLVHAEQSEMLVIAYRLADGTLWERRLIGGALTDPAQITARSVVVNAVDSQQAGADIVNDGEALHVLFIDAQTRSLYAVHDCGAGWSEPVLRVDGIEGSWVRGAVHRFGEGPSAYRYVYDAGSQGGSGMNRSGEIALTMCE
jgi:hypothetical protein